MENGIKIYKRIAQELAVINNPKADSIWEKRAFDNLHYIERELLPSGSGVDSGCVIDLSKSTPNKIVIQVNFHHMNENGCYDGWSYHNAIITPSLGYDYDIKITGRDKNEIKGYLGDLIYEAVDGEIVNKITY